MNLTSDTVAILKNFSDINQNILVKPGNQLQTISTLKNILAQADVTEKFDQEFDHDLMVTLPLNSPF